MRACECASVCLCERKSRKEAIAYSKKNMCWAVMPHAFNPSTWEAEAGGSL